MQRRNFLKTAALIPFTFNLARAKPAEMSIEARWKEKTKYLDKPKQIIVRKDHKGRVCINGFFDEPHHPEIIKGKFGPDADKLKHDHCHWKNGGYIGMLGTYKRDLWVCVTDKNTYTEQQYMKLKNMMEY